MQGSVNPVDSSDQLAAREAVVEFDDIHVYERNRPDDTFGWGVVFSDQTLSNLRENDPVSADRIFGAFHHWDDIDIHFRGECIRSSGHGFAGLSRQRGLELR